MKKLLLLLCMVIVWLNSLATHYFVSTAGNNGNNGTSTSTSWQTIAKVNATTFAPGDIISFNGGDVFIGSLVVRNSGSSGNPITYNSYGSGKAIITGFAMVSGFNNLGGNIYESVNPVSTLSTLNMVTIGGVQAVEGRWPNANVGYATYQSAVANTSITSSALSSAPTNNWAGAEVVIRKEPWYMDKNTVTSQAGNTLNYPSGSFYNGRPGYGFFIQNHVLTLDAQNEWYYNPAVGNKKIRIFSATGSPTNVQVATIDTLIWINQKAFITIDGLDIRGANKDCIAVISSANCTIQNCNIDFSGIDAISGNKNGGASAANFICQDNTLNHTNNNAIFIESQFTTANIRRNTISNTGQIPGTGSDGRDGARIYCGILTYVVGATTELNNIINAGYCGVVFVGSNNIVRFNYINTFCNTVQDGAGIYTFGSGFTNQKVFNNIVLNGIGNNQGIASNNSALNAHGLYFDDLTANIEAYNNTCANMINAGIYLHNSQNHNIHDNTLYNNRNALLCGSSNSGNPIRNITLQQNIMVARTNSQLVYDLQSNQNDIPSFGAFNFNRICRPIDDNLTISAVVLRNLAMWVTFSGDDVNSTKSPQAISNVNQLNFVYNETNVATVVNVPPSIDMLGASYSGNITLQPYTSRVLINTGSQTTPTITWNNPAAITYGTALSGTQLNATSGGVPGTFTYTPASGTILNAGTQTLNVLFTPTDGVTYTTASKSVTIVVNKATATLTYSNLTQTYNGSPLAPTITTNPAGLTVVNTTYNGIGMTPINAGTYAVVSGLTNSNYTASTISGTFTINKASATINISNLNQTYDGSPKPITVVTSPAGLSGIAVTYNGSSTVPTNAGSYPIVVTLTNTNYNAPNATGTLVIGKATPIITWSNPAAITYGTLLSGTQLNATSSVAGTFTYTPASGTLLNAGTQTLSVNFVPTDATNYNSVSNTTVSLVVNKATATIALSGLAQTYDGTGKSATATTTPAGLTVVSITYNGSATLPVNAGSYAVVASLSNANYTATNASGTLVIAKATATLTLSNLTQTYNGAQHAVTVTTAPAGLTVLTVLYNGSATAPTNAGSYPIVASLSNPNYQATNATGTLVINKLTPTITWNNPVSITYGTPLSGTQLNATSSIAGTFIYTPPAGTILSAGSQTLLVDFTPTDGTNYNSVNGTSVTIVVNKATATISLSNLAQVYTGSPLSATATTTPAGLGVISITYNGSPTPPTNAGSYAVVASLSNPNYNAANASGTLVISKATATLAISSSLTQTYDGTPKPVTVTTSPAGLTVLTITYNFNPTAPTNAASYNVDVSLSNANYQATPITAVLVIQPEVTTVSWATPSAIIYGTALSGTQLNATASTTGTFIYTPAAGAILNAGTQLLSVDFTSDDGNHTSVSGTTVNLVVNKATAVITLSNMNQTFDGSPKPVTVSVAPSVGVITVTYDGSTTAPSAVGTYAVVASLSNTNYTATPATGNLVISSSAANIFITNISQTYTGSPLPVTVTTSPPSLPYLITYNGSSTVPTNVGTYTVIATINDGGAHTGADTATYVINKANPIVSWSNPAAITFGTALSGTQLNATANVPGVFTYTPVSGTILNAGTQTLSVNFVPTDGSNYNTVNGTTVSIVVNKATATLTLSNLAQSFDGNPKPVTVTPSPAGLTVIAVTYNGSPTAPSAVGSYAVVATLNNSNYTATPANGTLVISTASATVTITNINQTYTGSPLPVTITTNPAGLPTTVTYNGSSTVPTNAGTYAVFATINDGIHTGSNSATLTINKATPTVSWSNPSAITFGTALSGTQLNATASVAGTFTYTPISGTILNAGTQILSVDFAPTDGANYNSVAGTTVSIVVNKAVATLTLSNLAQAFDGTPKPVTVTSSPAGLTVISVTYNGSNTVPSAIGSYAISATLNNSNYTATPATGTLVISSTPAGIVISNLAQVYTGGNISVTVTTNPSGISNTVTYNGSATLPINVGSYTVIATLNDGIHTGADTQTLVISKATPVITWPNPASITFGTALSGTQLNATVNAAGGLTYSPVSGTVLNVGVQSLSVTFTPTDPANFNSVNKIVTITVNKATAGLSLSNLLQVYNGTPKPVTVTSTPSGLSGITVTYGGSSTVPVNAGSYAIVVSLVNDNYQATPIVGTLVVSKANAILSWATPAPITQGTPLSATQLNATANIPGSFSYNPPAGTILNSGTTGIVATFTPTDGVNYNTSTIQVPMSVTGTPFLQWYLTRGSTWYMNLPGQIFPQ